MPGFASTSRLFGSNEGFRHRFFAHITPGPAHHIPLAVIASPRLNRATPRSPTMHNPILVAMLLCTLSTQAQASDWTAYGGDGRGQRYAPLTPITPKNVANLELAWTFRTGELGQGFIQANDALTFEATPLLIGDTLYFATATGKAIALDAATGVQRWRFDAQVDPGRYYSEMSSRGVSYWRGANVATGVCVERILFASIDARL